LINNGGLVGLALGDTALAELTNEAIDLAFAAKPYFRKLMIEPIPLPYLGRPEDVAAACLFLASDEARFITNVILPVNGGVYV